MTDAFARAARDGAAALGMPDLARAVVPHPMGLRPRHEVEAIADAIVDEVIRNLTELATKARAGRT
ncbi:MAG: hypothetical protein HYX89_00995 [Chloroflexi bacterium]|nr:hypothetical protein [Chloroflexota bacterium]